MEKKFFQDNQDECPECGSDEIINEDAEHDGILEVDCLCCGFQWAEPFLLN